MKRLFCMLLVAAMLLGFMPAVALQASAADGIGIEKLVLSDLPEELVPGPAQAPDVEVLEGEVEVVQVQWRVNEMDEATTLLADQAYFLAITLEPKDGYYFEDWLEIEANREEYMSTYEDEQQRTVFYRYSLLENVGPVKAQINQPYEGMDVADLTCAVEGNATVKSINVYNSNTGYMMEEGVFGPLCNYQITYVLEAKPGYEFADHGDLEVNDGEKYVEWSADGKEMYFWIYFSTCIPIETVEMTLGDITPGMAWDAVEMTVDPDAPYVIVDTSVYYQGDNESEAFENGENYELSFQLTAKEGYVFSEEVRGYINGEAISFWSYGDCTYADGWMGIYFSVDDIWLGALPDEIQPGAAELPQPECNSQVEITDVKWVNEAKQPVTSFVDGQAYYLALTVEAQGTRAFGQEPDIELDWNRTYTFEKLSDKQAVIYVRYSLEPSVGVLDMSVSGVEVGDKFEDVEIEIDGNATFDYADVSVYVPMSPDSYTTEAPDSDAFEAGKIYLMECYLQPKPGYRFGGDFEVYVNGEGVYDWGYRGEDLMVIVPVNTCDEITTVKLTMPEIEVGEAFSDLQVKVPTNAKYTATTQWIDMSDGWTEATGKVKDGHYYEARIVLQAVDGYAFAEDVAATLNGEKLTVSVEGPGSFVVGWVEKNFQKPITKVELPAMPASIQKGDTLPMPTVSSSKNYTLTAYWGMMGGDEITKAEEDGIYLLVYTAEPKDGYTFTDDTKYYIGGKEIWPLERGWRDAQFLQSYNIGMDEVTRIDITYQEPQPGEPAPEVMIPDDANYSLSQVSWGQSATGEWGDIEDVNKLQSGLYTYAYGMVAVDGGLALSKDAVFYANGKKIEPMAFYNFGQYAIVLFELGKLGEVEKLTAPELSKDGELLSWNAVLNATGYEIYRATSKSGKYTKVATVTDTAWQDSVTAGKTYYYKVKAVYSVDSSKNSGYSGYVSIAYKCDEPAITVVNGSSGKPVISWEKISGAKKYTVYRATAVDGKYTKLGTTTKLTYTDSKAKAGTEYFYKVIANASKSIYNSGYSNISSCYVVCGTPSVAVKNDAATGKPTLSWSKITGAAKYEVYLLGAEDYVVLGTVTGTSFTDESCAPGEGRYYGVRAIAEEESCNSEVSEPVLGRAACARPKVTGQVNSDGKPVISWEPVEGAAQYEIYRSTKATKSYSLLVTLETSSYVDESVAGGKTYYYKVVAVGENNKSAESAYVKLTGKCAAPEITVVNGDSGKPVISWAKINGAKKYTVYRATAVDGKYKKLGTTTKLSYTDSKATAGAEYFYKVVANGSKSAYNSIDSNVCMCYVICGTPSVTVKVDAATGKPSLSWGKVTGAVEYIILRQLDGEETFSELTRVTGTSFKDETAPIDTLCRYRVQALGEHEMLNGAYSKVVEATSAIAQPKLQSGVNSEGKPHFSWGIIEGAVKYEIYRSTKATKSYKLLATVVDGNAYVDETVAPGKTYYYKVVAIGEVSKSAESAYVKLTGKCAAPWISIALHETGGKPVISWEKVTGAKNYTVYRATSLEGKYSKLGTTKSLSYTDSKAVPGTEYYYKVVANGSKSSYNSNYSNVKFAVGYAAQPQVTLKNDSKGKPVVSWKKISEAEKYIVVYVDITDVENESDLTEQFILDNLQYVEVSKKKTSTTLSQAQTGRIYLVCVVAMPKNTEFFGISQPGYVAATCAAPKISGKYLQGYNCGTWKAVEGAEYYAIYRSTKKSGGYELLGYIDNDSSFVDLSAVKGKTYYYKVTACTEYTESEFSNYIKLQDKVKGTSKNYPFAI